MYLKYKLYNLLPGGGIYKIESYSNSFDFINDDDIILVVINDYNVFFNHHLFKKSLNNLTNDNLHKEIINELKK